MPLIKMEQKVDTVKSNVQPNERYFFNAAFREVSQIFFYFHHFQVKLLESGQPLIHSHVSQLKLKPKKQRYSTHMIRKRWEKIQLAYFSSSGPCIGVLVSTVQITLMQAPKLKLKENTHCYFPRQHHIDPSQISDIKRKVEYI